MMSDKHTTEKGQQGAANLMQRKPANTHCIQCGRPLPDCTVGGLHGMIRDRAAAAKH